jgi:SPP1 gp7 family putative phage head morphogenesis protein
VKGHVREAVERKDVLHLGTQRARNASPNPRDYRFLTKEEKEDRFIAWLERKIDDEVLVVDNRDAVRRGNHQTAQYVRKAYSKGVQHAGAKLRQQGVDVDQLALEDIFNTPVHSSKLETLYLRAYDNLEGITEATGEEISEELADALSQGWNPRKAASQINDRVDAVGITRARVLARTEIIHAHAEGTLDRLESEGFEEVTADVEWSTAGDSRVCPICASLEGNTYTIEEARGRLPQHPQCRCAWLPLVEDGD